MAYTNPLFSAGTILPNPVWAEGLVFYLDSNDASQGFYVSDGGAWILFGGLTGVQTTAVRAMVSSDGNLQYPSTTSAAFVALAAVSGLRLNAIYNVDGTLQKATSTSTYTLVVTAAQVTAAQFASLPLTAGLSGLRQAVGGARQLSLTSAGGGSIYYRFVDASGAIAVSSSDSSVALSTTAVALNVPSGSPFLEYLRLGGSDIVFTANLLA